MVISNGGDKRRFLLIVKGQWYLMVSLESIKETHSRMAYRCIDQLIYPKKGERIFRTGFVQVCEVYTYPPLSVLLFYHHSVGQPLRVKNFLDSPCSLKFSHIVLNSFIMVFGWAPGWLLSRSDWWVDIQVMADKIRINSWGFASVLSKHVNILSKEFNECLFFMREQLCPNLKKNFWISVNDYSFQIFTNRLLGWPSPWWSWSSWLL